MAAVTLKLPFLFGPYKALTKYVKSSLKQFFNNAIIEKNYIRPIRHILKT